MKQSFVLIFVQLLAVIVGLFTTLFMAVKLPPELFAIIGIHAISTSVIVTFSNTGLETLALRNILFWKKNNKFRIIDLITTQAVMSRAFMSIFYACIFVVYSFYISLVKFNGEYLVFFLLFVVSGVFMSINDSLRLILKANNRFVEAVTSAYYVSVFGKLIAVFLFVKIGLEAYLYTVILLPLTVFPYLFILNKKNIKAKHINRGMFSHILKSKDLAFSSYFSYFIKSVDQLLVSLFMSPEFLGVFSLAKKLVEFLKTFIANFFDPVLQKFIRDKGNFDALMPKLKAIHQWKIVFVLLLIILIVFVYLFGDIIIQKASLTKYYGLNTSIILILIGFVAFMFSKIEYYLIASYLSPKDFLFFTIKVSLISIISFVFVSFFFNQLYIYSYFALSHVLIYFLSVQVIKKQGGLKTLVNKIKL